MAKKYTEIGELRENEDKSLYIKVFIKAKDGGSVIMNSGDTLRLEDPKLKYDRLIASAEKNGKDTEQLHEERNNIPTYVKRRVTLVQGKAD